MTLSKEQCKPCRLGGTPLSPEDTSVLAADIPQWELVGSKIQRSFTFRSFREAIDFVNRVAEAAEEQDHHPDIFVDYRTVTLILWTKKVGGLTCNDFILATKIDNLAASANVTL